MVTHHGRGASPRANPGRAGSAGAEGENYLRGVQPTDAEGLLAFTSVFPGCYQGRCRNIHFEVYPDVAATSDASR